MELFHQLIYEQFALYEPCSITFETSDKFVELTVIKFIPGGLYSDWLKEILSDWWNKVVVLLLNKIFTSSALNFDPK